MQGYDRIVAVVKLLTASDLETIAGLTTMTIAGEEQPVASTTRYSTIAGIDEQIAEINADPTLSEDSVGFVYVWKRFGDSLKMVSYSVSKDVTNESSE